MRSPAARPCAALLSPALALALWSVAGCATATVTAARSPGPQQAIDRLLVIVRNHPVEREGRRIRRTIERALDSRQVPNRCIYLPEGLDPKWVQTEIDRFKPAGILIIKLLAVVNTEKRRKRYETQYDASLFAVADPERRIWRAKAVAHESFDGDADDRSDKVAEGIVEQLARDKLLAAPR
jgi:hypothetical protein